MLPSITSSAQIFNEALESGASAEVPDGDGVPVEIHKTQGVNSGAACIGTTRIAVWMLEAARRSGLSDREILVMYPRLNEKHLMLAWWYVAGHSAEIEESIRANAKA